MEQRRNYCTLSKVVLRLVHFTADVLQLLPPPQSSALSLIQRLSMHPAWVLMNEENCFHPSKSHPNSGTCSRGAQPVYYNAPCVCFCDL